MQKAMARAGAVASTLHVLGAVSTAAQRTALATTRPSAKHAVQLTWRFTLAMDALKPSLARLTRQRWHDPGWMPMTLYSNVETPPRAETTPGTLTHLNTSTQQLASNFATSLP